MKAKELLTDKRGVATSLLEATLVLGIAAIISSVALVSAMDYFDAAQVSRAQSDVEMLGIAVHSFINDNGFAPRFKSGAAHGPDDAIFLVLESQGSDPAEMEARNWPIETTARDRLENHLIRNLPSGVGPRYPRVGEISFARQKGWNGPYLGKLPSSDPWDNKYLINVQFLSARPVNPALASPALELGTGQRPSAFVISGGPNRQLETRFDQAADGFTAGGDDIVFRIQ